MNKSLKVAEIVPLRFLNMTSKNMYHMCLAHLVLKSEEYALFYRRMSDEGKYVLVDNGACEGEKMSYDDLMRVYDIIRPTEIILPDVLFDKEETLERTYFFLDNYNLRRYKKMVVPQGQDLDQWKECCDEMLVIDEVNTIGIPKWLGGAYIGSRPAICEKLTNTDKEIHLLGCSEGPKVLLDCKRKNPNVRGCDSAFAYLCAKAGVKVIDSETKRPGEKIDFLNDTKGSETLDKLMADFEIAAGAYNNLFEEGWM